MERDSRDGRRATTDSRPAAGWADGVRSSALVIAMFLALSAFTPRPQSGRIMFARQSNVPPAIQAFAWTVIETRCNFQQHELERLSFWAYDAQRQDIDGEVVYSIKVLSDLHWKKTEPPATVQMLLADDGGRVMLKRVTSSFIQCRA